MKMTMMLEGLKLQECCANHCRDWRETLGGKLPASNHSPSCENYKTEQFFKVTIKGENGPFFVLEKQEDVDDLRKDQEEYDVTTIEMTRDQFERLTEFNGF